MCEMLFTKHNKKMHKMETLGDGNSINVWESSWIPNVPNFKPRCQFEDDRRRITWVRDLLLQERYTSLECSQAHKKGTLTIKSFAPIPDSSLQVTKVLAKKDGSLIKEWCQTARWLLDEARKEGWKEIVCWIRNKTLADSLNQRLMFDLELNGRCLFTLGARFTSLIDDRISLDDGPSGATCRAISYLDNASSYSPALNNEFPSSFASLALANPFYFKRRNCRAWLKEIKEKWNPDEKSIRNNTNYILNQCQGCLPNCYPVIKVILKQQNRPSRDSTLVTYISNTIPHGSLESIETN
ncbi:transducin/WD40 repeat-like superfamily protein [Striga asiatica]|uniref:Transducin/WD40 repeat-like superfamily protein n=1 Tax=Striga asiatica TaxID=4170 RepID=A0A5A7Q8Z5_STRAF|nr:transducin/WD40 repeat-like superfamily protein [Striga asiatica]